MGNKRFFLAILTILAAGLMLAGAGCSKKVAPPPAATPAPAPAPAPPPVAPSISFAASPSAIEQGQSSTLSWNSTNATEVTIDGGIGSVPASGSRTVSPTTSITYRARATGPGGSAEAEARLTVTARPAVAPPVRPLSDAEFFTTNVKDIFFDYDQYDIRLDARSVLQANARALAERSGLRFRIEGHCDERGSEKYNLALGDRRANAARDFLIGQGVSADRIETISYGKERPFCSESNEDCWQKNRRAHFVMR